MNGFCSGGDAQFMDNDHPEILNLLDNTDGDTLWSLTYVADRAEPADVYRLHWALVGAQPTDGDLDVASVLVPWKGQFVHVLEGPRDQVLAVFDGVVFGSDRERGVILADQGPIGRRSIDPAQVLDIRGTANAYEAEQV